MSRNIAYKIRMALQVATACAEEVLNGTGEMKKRPVLLNMPESPNQAMTFRFEGGIVVQVALFDYRQVTGETAEDWRVHFVHIARLIAGDRDEVVWGARILDRLRKRRPWDGLATLHVEDTQFRVGAFYNQITGGFAGTDIYPYCNMAGMYLGLWEKSASIVMSRLAPMSNAFLRPAMWAVPRPILPGR